MSGRLYVGPYDSVEIGTAETAPWYVIPFDERGRCTGPLTRDHLIAAAHNDGYTDIYVFSHGWNNDWRDAIGDDRSGVATGTGYRGMINAYIRLRRSKPLPYTRPYKPLLVGVFWPSAWFVLPWEAAPSIAASDLDAQKALERKAQEAIAAQMADEDVETFYRLMQEERITEVQALELARILQPLYATDLAPGDIATPGVTTPSELVETWRAIRRRQQPVDTGDKGGPVIIDGGTLNTSGGTTDIAGGPGGFDPRIIARAASVWMMKDRAGTVGSRGVANLLGDLLNANPSSRVHVIGHSFGCRVLLSAICHLPSLPNSIPIHSALLLQPAISHLCFATNVAGSGKAGGYRPALERIKKPLMLTFSNEDEALHDFFHLALVRPSDVGEGNIAGDADEPPNVFAALGGYGPRGFADGECQTLPIKSLHDPYDLGAHAPAIYALNSKGVIHGHGDYNKDHVWWALYSLVAR